MKNIQNGLGKRKSSETFSDWAKNEDDPSSPKRAFTGIWIPEWICTHPDLTATEKMLLGEISSFTSKKRGCYASNEYLAKNLKTSAGNVAGMLTKLRKLELVRTESFDGRRRYLRVTEP